jgi:hypothetical protein
MGPGIPRQRGVFGPSRYLYAPAVVCRVSPTGPGPVKRRFKTVHWR